jgi:hypothetical protein
MTSDHFTHVVGNFLPHAVEKLGKDWLVVICCTPEASLLTTPIAPYFPQHGREGTHTYTS